MKLIATINLDNAAFEDDPDQLPRLLRYIAGICENGAVSQGDGFPVMDRNGNTVGEVIIE